MAETAGWLPVSAQHRVRSRGRRAAAVVAALAGLLLCACGGTGGGDTGGTGPSGEGSGSSRPPTTPPGTPATPSRPSAITVRSPAFAESGVIPVRFTCRGSNTPPPLAWSGMPAGTASVALVMDDPDAPGGTYTHWVVFNLPPTSVGITGGRLPAGAAQGQNTGGQAAYTGPCPPSGIHHYRFTVYAEDKRLPLRDGASLREALNAINANAVASGRLTGRFG